MTTTGGFDLVFEVERPLAFVTFNRPQGVAAFVSKRKPVFRGR